MNKRHFVFFFLISISVLRVFGQAKPQDPAKKTTPQKTTPLKKGKLLITSDSDCNLTFNGKNIGNLKAGKPRIVIGTFGENSLEASYGLSAPPSAKDKNTKPAAEAIIYQESVLINDTGVTPFNIEFLGPKMFYQYVRDGNKTMLELCLKNKPQLIKPQEEAALDPLLLAIQKGKIDIAQLLIDKGADINLKTENTPLNAAIAGNNVDIVKLLVNKGADLDLTGEDGNTPLQEAVFWGKFDIVKILLEKGAKTTTQYSDGSTVLKMAYDKGFNSIALELKKYGAQE